MISLLSSSNRFQCEKLGEKKPMISFIAIVPMPGVRRSHRINSRNSPFLGLLLCSSKSRISVTTIRPSKFPVLANVR